ncbi:uncharacterized protein BDZ99DRAFT_461761 [Mytilinidion resinicola]|uniref:Uncharacterized protein n=1 Tax=Mytilinidion resinicola TaxID=574789 RepID=A0A6A6YUU4_9PEZI|nr:uncharacterized protein BDZ99DRAFT_461761 [Mytilinidion resinicola]KAF2811764.1 hypothetical protein BDZ99DRAFT_461761 [Mytilinidion resinicola]
MEGIFAAATGSMTADELNKIEKEHGKPAHKAIDAEVKFINAIVDNYVLTGIHHGLELVEMVHVAVQTANCWGTPWGNPNDPSLSEPVIVDLLQWGKGQGLEQNGFINIIQNAVEKHYSTPRARREPTLPTQKTSLLAAGDAMPKHPGIGLDPGPQTTRQLPKKFAPNAVFQNPTTRPQYRQ